MGRHLVTSLCLIIYLRDNFEGKTPHNYDKNAERMFVLILSI